MRQAAALLDLDYSEARFGSVDEIYKSESSRDILAEPTLLFSEAEKQKDASPTAQDCSPSWALPGILMTCVFTVQKR
ncbi:hypothetical protein SBADM41S_10022 [Streptomyces badius]